MRTVRVAALLVAFLALVLMGCSGEEGTDEPTTTTSEGCVETVRGCIDPDSIEPGECVPSGPDNDDCVNYRPLPDEGGTTTSTSG